MRTKSNERVYVMNRNWHFVVHKLICLCTIKKIMEILVSQGGSSSVKSVGLSALVKRRHCVAVVAARAWDTLSPAIKSWIVDGFMSQLKLNERTLFKSSVPGDWLISVFCTVS